MRDLHLREEETGAAELFFFVARSWAAPIQSPIPQRKNEHIGQPKQCAGPKKLERRFPVRRQGPDQEKNRADQRDRGDAVDENSQNTVERTFASAVTHHGWNEENNNNCR